MQMISAYPSVPEKTGPKIPCEARRHTLQEMPLADGGAQRGADDVDHRLRHPAEDQAVHQHAEVDGAKSAQKCGGLAGIAHLRELHVGHQARAPPQARERENRHHSGGQERPPDPVSGDSLRVNQARDQQRSVRRERGGHHRSARQPPGNGAPGNKIIFGTSAGGAAKIQSQQESNQQVSNNRGPIQQSECHGRADLWHTSPGGGNGKSKRRFSLAAEFTGDSLKNSADFGTEHVTLRCSWERHGRSFWNRKARGAPRLLTGNDIFSD